jgi:hypothetical protein
MCECQKERIGLGDSRITDYMNDGDIRLESILFFLESIIDWERICGKHFDNPYMKTTIEFFQEASRIEYAKKEGP